LKTVAEISKIANVSTKTVYRHLDKLRKDVPDDLTVSNAGITYFTLLGEEKILERLTGVRQMSDIFETVSDTVEHCQSEGKDIKNPENEEIIYLRELVKDLQTDLRAEREFVKEKDVYIKELTEKITDLTERLAILFENSQQLQQNQQLLEAKNIVGEKDNEDVEASKEKQSFIARLFKKKR